MSKKCHICGKEVKENYYLDERGYTCYTCSKAIANEKSKIKQLKQQFDYRVTELKCTILFDYMENDTFEEFYLKLKRLCDEYKLHLTAVTRREDVMTYEVDNDDR